MRSEYDQAKQMELLQQYGSLARESYQSPISVKEKYDHIVLCGYGAEGNAARLVKRYAHALPIQVHDGVSLPSYLTERSLVILVSYTGGSPEQLHLLQECIERELEVVVCSSGGPLSALAQEQSIPVLALLKGLLPRFSLLSVVFGLLALFHKSGLLAVEEDALFAQGALAEESEQLRLQGEQLAQNIVGKDVVLVCSSSTLASIKHVQFICSVNAKKLLSVVSVPDAVYGGLEGVEGRSVVLFRDSVDLPLVVKGMDVLRDLVPCYVVSQSSGNLLHRLLAFCVIGDWCSYYLALMDKRDPSDTKFLQEFDQQYFA